MKKLPQQVAILILIVYASGLINSMFRYVFVITTDFTLYIFVILEIIYLLNLLRHKIINVNLHQNNQLYLTFYHILLVIPVILSILGAFRLNNGYPGGLVAFNILLILILVLISIYFKLYKYFSYQIYVSSLAILFMTSMRSWYVSGHDNIREFSVFLLTQNHGYWSMSWLRDAYNACLSITILPNLIKNIFSINNHYIFKIFYPIIISFVPVALYELFRSKFKELMSLITTFLFIVFPAYYQDITMLNRQGIAMLFYILFIDEILKPTRTIYRYIFFIGVILSHYSSSYLLMAVILYMWTMQTIVRYFKRDFGNQITLNDVLIYLLIVYVWSGLITNTLSGPFQSIYKSYQMLSESVTSNQVVDVNYNIFKMKKVDESINITKIVNKYSTDKTVIFDPNKFIYHEKLQPLTSLGLNMQYFSYQPYVIIKTTRQIATIFYQILPILSIILILFIRPNQFFLPLMSSVGYMLISVIFLYFPSISKDYGILRLYMQSYPVFGLISIQSVMWTSNTLDRKVFTAITSILLIIFITIFLSNLGFLTSIFGGYNSQYHFANNGDYFNRLYTHKSDIISLLWVKKNVSKFAAIQTPAHTAILSNNWYATKLDSRLLPSIVNTSDSYTLLDYSSIKFSYAQSYIHGEFIPHKIYLDDYLNQSIIYSNKYSIIFK